MRIIIFYGLLILKVKYLTFQVRQTNVVKYSQDNGLPFGIYGFLGKSRCKNATGIIVNYPVQYFNT